MRLLETTLKGTTPAKFAFIWFSVFRGKDLNVKVYEGHRTPSDDKSPYWPSELKKSFYQIQFYFKICT